MRVAVVVAFAAVLAGCGSASVSSLEDAADATAAETSRFEYRFSFGARKWSSKPAGSSTTRTNAG
jgi:hypothetical protein